MAFYPGQMLNDGSIVRFNGKANSFTDSGLTLDIPYYYHVYNQYNNLTYSISVSTSVFLDLPPLAPAGLAAAVNADRTQAVISWSNVTSNSDGSSFLAPSSPQAVELVQYRVDRATTAASATWVALATVPAASLSYTDSLPDPDQTYFYRVSAIDSLGTQETAMAVDTEQRRFAIASDGVTRLQIPKELGGELLAAANAQGKDLIIRAVEEPAGDVPTAVKSVRFEAVITPDNTVVTDFQFDRPELSVVMGYEVAGGQVVASGGRRVPGVSVSAAEAPQGLGMYWHNGDKYVKLYGSVNPADQTVSVRTSMMGSYQLRTLYRDSGVSFDISNLNHKAITPNGDGLNDTSVFTFDNPRDSAFSGKIYDLSGAFVADMTPGPVSNSLQWNGRAGGRAVASGVYAYQIKAENKVFNGTLMVIK
ncbi:MAG: hypothetical protein A3J79_02120 [Elusimicrobia bacterium RIFOXYB2_FULL_62_6]|nr:MAG: hypothetical protein A3J79_02120 [Elusimicrobia bacterium RIFOXYB2_FULL_62_6]